jgi:hypothetical protein
MRWDNWFYEGLGGFLQSSEQGIVRQTTFGGGRRTVFCPTNPPTTETRAALLFLK